MTGTRIRQESGGARVIFCAGAPFLRPRCAPPQGAVSAAASIVSPGTEMRHLRESASGSDHLAGYINIAYRPGFDNVMLAPAPHGAWMRLDHARSLTAPADVPLAVIAAARFQLIAAAGMRHTAFVTPPSAVVVGSGPIALGCCLELVRRGTRSLTLVSGRDQVPFAGDLDIPISRSVTGDAAVVLDATGKIETLLSMVAPGGTLGLLGTPDPGSTVSALHAHRKGVAVVGMHELACYDHDEYQRKFTEVLAWLAATFDRETVAGWCTYLREDQIIDHYRQLAGNVRNRGVRPITILEWSA